MSILGVAIAVALSAGALELGAREIAFPIMCLSIAIITWSQGRGPGAIAVVLSAICYEYFFTAPNYSFQLLPSDVPHFLLFVLSAVAISYFAARQLQQAQDLRNARDHLQGELDWRAEQTLLLERTHDAIIFRSLDGTISYWNHGAREMYGWTAQDAIGVKSHSLLRTRFPIPLDEINEQLLRGGLWEGELRHTRRDGTEVISASRWSLRQDDGGRPLIIMETNNDISERKRREQEVSNLNAELNKRADALELANRELEAFTYSVSHDLRAPIRHIAGFAELLQKHAASTLDDKGRKYLRTIQDSAKRMGTLIDDLLAFSRVGRAETRKGIVSLEQLARETISELAGETAGRAISWKIGALPTCYGDRSMLKLVLHNLIANAVKFTRSRTPAEIEIGSSAGPSDNVIVFIRDNGVGFDMRYSDKLFGVFQRLHAAEDFEGTGIGLAIVQRIIQRHDGEVRAEGKPDGGATFYFSLCRRDRTREQAGLQVGSSIKSARSSA